MKARRPQCPRCRAYLRSGNPGPFCSPCCVPGWVWHEPAPGEWVRIYLGVIEPAWEPGLGDVVLTGLFEPEPRRPDRIERFKRRWVYV